MIEIAVLIYAGLAGFAALFQLAVALGAPWGHLTMGGRYQGQLPVAMRMVAVVQGGILVLMALVLAHHAGLIGHDAPRWTLWAVIAVSALSCGMNFATPSASERRLWGPVTAVMLICAGVVASG